MADNLNEMSDLLLKRFKSVPNVDLTDCTEWMEQAFLEHGYDADETLRSEDKRLVLLFAEADGVTQVALRVSYYFQYTDGEEKVDKTKVAAQYRSLASDLWDRYYRKRNESGASRDVSRFFVMQRPDR